MLIVDPSTIPTMSSSPVMKTMQPSQELTSLFEQGLTTGENTTLTKAMSGSEIGNLAEDKNLWHSFMKDTIGYDDRGSGRKSEEIRQDVLAAIESGDWSDLDVSVSFEDEETLNGKDAVFEGGDPSVSSDDQILIHRDLQGEYVSAGFNTSIVWSPENADRLQAAVSESMMDLFASRINSGEDSGPATRAHEGSHRENDGRGFLDHSPRPFLGFSQL